MPKRILQIMDICTPDVQFRSIVCGELFFDRQNNSWTKAGNAVSEKHIEERQRMEFRMGPVQVLYPMEPYLWGFSKMVTKWHGDSESS